MSSEGRARETALRERRVLAYWLIPLGVAVAGTSGTIETVSDGSSWWFAPALWAAGALIIGGGLLLLQPALGWLWVHRPRRSGAKPEAEVLRQEAPTAQGASSSVKGLPASASDLPVTAGLGAASKPPTGSRDSDAGGTIKPMSEAAPKASPVTGGLRDRSSMSNPWLELDTLRAGASVRLRTALAACDLVLPPGMPPQLMADEALRRELITNSERQALDELDRLIRDLRTLVPVPRSRIEEVTRILDVMDLKLMVAGSRRR